MFILCVCVSECVGEREQELNCNEFTLCVYLEYINTKHYIGIVH